MLTKEKIIALLNELHEHKMAKEIFVPVLQAMKIEGVRYTGGDTEMGIDVEFYELSKPEKNKNYVGIQFKKGNITYGAGGGKGTVKEIKNQADEAFSKEIYDIDGKGGVHYIHRFIVATTGDINEPARQYIGRARSKGEDRLIDYWVGDRLAEYIQQNWMFEFENYFKDKLDSVKEAEEIASIINSDYIEDNYTDLVKYCRKYYSTLNYIEREIIISLIILNGQSSISDLLFEIEKDEESVTNDLKHLIDLYYIEIEDNYIEVKDKTLKVLELYSNIIEELNDAEEDKDEGIVILRKLLKN